VLGNFEKHRVYVLSQKELDTQQALEDTMDSEEMNNGYLSIVEGKPIQNPKA